MFEKLSHNRQITMITDSMRESYEQHKSETDNPNNDLCQEFPEYHSLINRFDKTTQQVFLAMTAIGGANIASIELLEIGDINVPITIDNLCLLT
jgi:hypothetical protein